MRFSGKTVVVTGAASGIGAESARLFAREGAIVYAADIDAKGGAALAAEGAGDIRFVATDVCQVDAIEALMDRAAGETGGIDVLFNNAGAGGARAKIHEIEPADWDRTMDLLLRSVAFGIRYAAGHMRGRPGAAIVNTASVAATAAGFSPIAYAVAKAGVLHLTRVAAADLAQFGIRVNAILPGFINTGIFTRMMQVPDETKEIARAMIAQASANAQPVARGGSPRDIAEACAFLASDAASFITGTSLTVDGGLTIGQRASWDPETPGMLQGLAALEAQAAAGKSA